MISSALKFQPDYVIHPGEYIAELLESKNIKQSEIALQMGIPPKHLKDIINGRASITPGIASSLQDVLGYSVRYWLDLQAYYDVSVPEKSFIDEYRESKQTN